MGSRSVSSSSCRGMHDPSKPMLLTLFSPYTKHINCNPNTSQPPNLHPLSVVRRSFPRIILCYINFHMSEEQQQNLKDYPYEAVSLSNTVPSMAHNPTTMPRDSIVSRAQESNFSLG